MQLRFPTARGGVAADGDACMHEPEPVKRKRIVRRRCLIGGQQARCTISKLGHAASSQCDACEGEVKDVARHLTGIRRVQEAGERGLVGDLVTDVSLHHGLVVPIARLLPRSTRRGKEAGRWW